MSPPQPAAPDGAAPLRLICLGHATLDRVYQVAELPRQPIKVRAHGYAEVGGGMAANAACAIARLMAPRRGSVTMWGRAGDDAAGVTMRRELDRYGVGIEGFRLFPGCVSSQTAVLVDAAGERLIVNYRGDVPAEDVSWLDFGQVAGAAAVLTDVRWLAGAQSLLEAARRHGVPSVLDADLGELHIKAALVPLADHVVFSEPGFREWCGHDDHERGLRAAVALGARVAGITRGGAGSYFLLDDRIHHVPTHRVEVVDTLGAGDVFHGAYALAIGEGRPVLEAARFASAAAALKCTRHGGRTGAPERLEVEALLDV